MANSDGGHGPVNRRYTPRKGAKWRTCRRCIGRGQLPDSVFGKLGKCPRCNGSGVVKNDKGAK